MIYRAELCHFQIIKLAKRRSGQTCTFYKCQQGLILQSRAPSDIG